jgi:hypothetical protein
MRVNSCGSKGQVVPASLVAQYISKGRRHIITGATTCECYWKHTKSMDKDQSIFPFDAVTMRFLFHKEDFQCTKK